LRARALPIDLLLLFAVFLLPTGLHAQAHNRSAADVRAEAVERQMTDSERLQLLHGIMPIPQFFPDGATIPSDIPVTAGFVRGIAGLGVPNLVETDASLGVANPMQIRAGDTATALPSGQALAASFNPALLYEAGVVIGSEASAKGFNVLLGGGVNLARDPRNGRNFEYLGEDPWLAGTLAGAAIAGTQSQHVMSTIKHFAVNDQETQRDTLDVHIDEAALRESDLLAFEIAIEKGAPGAVMCAYNLVNGHPACNSPMLLNEVLKKDWRYPGFVMSDWGAVDNVYAINAGLDQESGEQLDATVWFDAPLRQAIGQGTVSHGRISDAVRRILRSMYTLELDQHHEAVPVDYQAHASLTRRAATEGIVLLKNNGVLPLDSALKSVLIVGGHADLGVLSGGGSSQVTPMGVAPTIIPVEVTGGMKYMGRQLYMPSSPLRALQSAMPATRFAYVSGYDVATAVAHAERVDLVIVFATKWQVESRDTGSLSLPEGQDELIRALSQANPHTLVVLETGNPVAMPWLDNVQAVVEAWYPGQEGGLAIADILTGVCNPSGRLPITFPLDVTQLPRPFIPGFGLPYKSAVSIDYSEGAFVGYRWYAREKQTPLFPFGYGLSYTQFSMDKLRVQQSTDAHRRPMLSAEVTVSNRGKRAGDVTAQVYVASALTLGTRRLVGYERLTLTASETRVTTLEIDPRLLAQWSPRAHQWNMPAGQYDFVLANSATESGPSVSLTLPAMNLSP
jgi:beta-glucosidase